MARITVEDCLEQIPNRFQLVGRDLPRPHAGPRPHAQNREQEQAWRHRLARNCRRKNRYRNA